METIETKVNLPSSFLTATEVKETELDEFIRRSSAVELYREGKPIIGLSRIGKLELLKIYFWDVHIPQEVFEDGDGRRIVESLGLKITGTIGLLLLAAEEGKLNLKKTIDDLMAVGFILSECEYKKIVGERSG